MGGDPFTSYEGRRAQFWLPTSKATTVITCDGMHLRAQVFGSGIAGDNQQWFHGFVVELFGAEMLNVHVREHASMHNALRPHKDDGVDIGVETVSAVSALRAQRHSAIAGEPLNVLNVTVAGRDVRRTGAGEAGALAYTVSRADSTEAVAVKVGRTEFTLFSSVAQKFAGAKAAAFVHVDLKFTKIAAGDCSGPLPEIWGVKPMTEATAQMLQPPQHEGADEGDTEA